MTGESVSTHRVLELLEAAAELGAGATGRQIAAHARIPRATAYRMLNQLVADGYLVRVDDLTGFALGRRARELADRLERPATPPVVAVVETLRSSMRQAVHLVGFDDCAAVVVDPDPDHPGPEERALLSSHHTSAVGLLLLAFRPELLTGDHLPGLTAGAITSWPRLLRQLGAVRADGLAVDRGTTIAGRVALAVPIRARSRVTGCLCVTGIGGRLDPYDPGLRHRLTESAQRLTGWDHRDTAPAHDVAARTR